MTSSTTGKRTALAPGGEAKAVTLSGDGFRGLTQSRLIGAQHGSVHQEVTILELAPGGRRARALPPVRGVLLRALR